MRFGAVAVALVVLGACAGTPAHRAEPLASRTLDRDAQVAACARLIAAADEAIDRAGVRDAGGVRVSGHPYLRADRYTAAAREIMSDEAWLGAMRSLDRTARRAEFANLPAVARKPLVARVGVAFPGAALEAAVESCAERLLAADLARGAVPDQVLVPDDYQTWKRVFGLYALTKYAFASGIRRYQAETLETFGSQLDALPVAGSLTRYVPSFDELALVRAGFDAESARLVVANAPVLEVDTASDHDRLGVPVLDDDGAPMVDISQPIVFVRTARTLFQGKPLEQIVYTFWFPSRPRGGSGDMLAGRLDGIVWRVTLDPDLRPWVFDTIHPCGCYHQFFPTPRAVPRPRPAGVDEWAFVPAQLPEVGPDDRIHLRAASATHYLQGIRVGAQGDAGVGYGAASDDVLRSVTLRNGTQRSLFRPDGIVSGTERGERWLLWPSGVREPGAMRQWGRHATAFVGRRHFDDPHLFARYFDYRP
jgi:hypothetical protein